MEPEDLTTFTVDELVERLAGIQGALESAQTELAAVHQEMRKRFPVPGEVPATV